MVARSQRQRLLEATIRVVAEKGYGPATVADLTREAGISRTTFYEMFEDKQACFLAAYDAAVDALVRRVVGAYEAAEGDWPERARVGLAERPGALAEEPALRGWPWSTSGGGTGGAAALPGRGAAADAELHDGRDFAPGGRGLPANVSRMAIGGVAGLIVDELLSWTSRALACNTPDVLFATLTPYLGPDIAAREVAKARL